MRAQDLMDKAKELMTNKGHDYTEDAKTNQYENFDKSNYLASWFNDTIDKSFVVLIGTKLARLATLLNGKSPKNESIEDSFLDLINYSTLWGGKRMSLLHHSGSNQMEPRICIFCKNEIIIPMIAVTNFIGQNAHLGCYNGRTYDVQVEFNQGKWKQLAPFLGAQEHKNIKCLNQGNL